MALYHKWNVKNGFAYVLQFFSLISEGLGSVRGGSGKKGKKQDGLHQEKPGSQCQMWKEGHDFILLASLGLCLCFCCWLVTGNRRKQLAGTILSLTRSAMLLLYCTTLQLQQQYPHSEPFGCKMSQKYGLPGINFIILELVLWMYNWLSMVFEKVYATYSHLWPLSK